VRRDCAPHRSGVLEALAAAAAVCAMLSTAFILPSLYRVHYLTSLAKLGGLPREAVAFTACAAVLWLVALTAGLTAFVLARRDLAEMQAGRMDPTGRRRTAKVRVVALVVVTFDLTGLGLLTGFLAMTRPW
jgi:hypothetical protein